MVGPPYQAALRLYALAGQRWALIDGEASLQGQDLLDLPPHRFCNVIYYWAVQRLSEEDKERWEAELLAPLPGQRLSASTVDPQQEMADFKRLMSLTG